MSVAGVRALGIGYFASISPRSLFSVAVEDIQHTAAVGGLHIVLIGSPDHCPVFLPAHAQSLAAGERHSQRQRLADPERGVFQLPDEAGWLCEKQ